MPGAQRWRTKRTSEVRTVRSRAQESEGGSMNLQCVACNSCLPSLCVKDASVCDSLLPWRTMRPVTCTQLPGAGEETPRRVHEREIDTPG